MQLVTCQQFEMLRPKLRLRGLFVGVASVALFADAATFDQWSDYTLKLAGLLGGGGLVTGMVVKTAQALKGKPEGPAQ